MGQRSGFTLVELSIVLVIIGLLIGGILAAQSMISTAKINAQVRQIGQFDAMVLNFKTKFNYLPGDAPAFGGDGNGVIAMTSATVCGATCISRVSVFSCEMANFWVSIDPQQFPGSSVCAKPGMQPEISGATKNVPESKLGKPNSYILASALAISNDTDASVTNPANYYAILDSSQAKAIVDAGWYYYASTTNANSAVRPVDLLALDAKMDDGVANTGNVISGSIGSQVDEPGHGGIVSRPASGICSSGDTYTAANSGYECTPLIRIGGSVGIPQ